MSNRRRHSCHGEAENGQVFGAAWENSRKCGENNVSIRDVSGGNAWFIIEAQGHRGLLRRLAKTYGHFLPLWDIRDVSVSGRVISYLGVLQESGGSRQHAGIFCLISDTSWAAANSIAGLYPRACIHTSKDACWHTRTPPHTDTVDSVTDKKFHGANTTG